MNVSLLALSAAALLQFSSLAKAGDSDAALGLPAPRDDGIPVAQIFEHRSDRSAYAARGVRFVWGASSAEQPAGVVASKYVMINRSAQEKPMVHSMDWYRKNHPDWIMYQQDRISPAYGWTYPKIGGFPPLNMSDGRVRDFYYETFVLPYLKQGYRMVAVDNVEFTNWAGRVGHYDEKGNWVQILTGRRNDPAYNESQIGELLDLGRRLHPLGDAVAANINFTSAPMEVIRRAIDSCDLWADEGGVAFHGGTKNTDKIWENKVVFLKEILPVKAYVPIDTLTTASPTRDDMEWIVANFLLVRGPRTLLAIRWNPPETTTIDDATTNAKGTHPIGVAPIYGTFDQRPELKINLGKPSSPPERDASGAWLRSYEHGVVVVNPSSKKAVSVRLPAGRWLNFENQPVENTLELGPATGSVLRDGTVPALQ